MVMASLRGVEVTLLLPSLLDHRWLKWVADAYLWQVLERGIKVYRHPPPFVHSKALIVDDRWVLLGSANLDRRSFRLNFEFNVEAYDEKLAATMNEWFDSVLERARPVTLEEMDSRPAWRRLRDGLAKTFSPHL
jgi:cardiolipin synthase